MATFESKNIVLTRKLDGVVYEIMVKTVADMVYVDDSTTLTEKLYDIADLFTEYGNRQNELAEAYSKLVAGADENYNTFKEIWDYININGNPKSELIQLIESKQTSEEGKGLSTNDLTDVLYEKLAECGIHLLTASLDVTQFLIGPYYYQRPFLLGTHALTCPYDRLPSGYVTFFDLAVQHPVENAAGACGGAYVTEETAYVFSEKDYYGYHAHVDQLVQYCTQQLHLEDL